MCFFVALSLSLSLLRMQAAVCSASVVTTWSQTSLSLESAESHHHKGKVHMSVGKSGYLSTQWLLCCYSHFQCVHLKNFNSLAVLEVVWSRARGGYCPALLQCVHNLIELLSVLSDVAVLCCLPSLLVVDAAFCCSRYLTWTTWTRKSNF